MNNLEYLNQISSTHRPTHKSRFKNIPIIKIILGGLAALVVIIVLGVVVNHKDTTGQDLVQTLYFRTANLSSTITEYNKSLKSSDLRAIGLSLSTTLASATNQLNTYLSSQETKPALPESASDSEVSNLSSFSDSLYKAKLNGVLDRIYLNQVRLQVSLLLNLIAQTSEHTDDAYLSEILSSFSSNLSLISSSLDAYSSPSD